MTRAGAHHRAPHRPLLCTTVQGSGRRIHAAQKANRKMTTTMRGSTGLEITLQARTNYLGEYEVTVAWVHAPQAAGADPYSGEHLLSPADTAAIWEALPETVQELVLQRCAEAAEPDDEDPPSERDTWPAVEP